MMDSMNQFLRQALPLYGVRIIEDPNVSDYDRVPRTWRERLLTRPWRPWRSYKLVWAPKAYQLKDGTFIMSPVQAAKMRAELAANDKGEK